MGLDDWNTQYCREITEDRLLAAIKKQMGAQVARLYLPPIKLDESQNDPGAPAIGVPVVPFPRWMRCPYCDTLSTVDSGVFKLSQDQWRPDRTEYRHEGCTKARGKVTPGALSVRFLLACREGHLTDFPWIEFVHNKTVACKPAQLTLREYGISGDASDIIVKCLSCNTERRMADAFDQDTHFQCPGHHPHLRRFDADPCPEQAKTILLGASNSWFSVSLSALSIPQATDRLAKLVEENWEDIKSVDSENELLFYRKTFRSFRRSFRCFPISKTHRFGMKSKQNAQATRKGLTLLQILNCLNGKSSRTRIQRQKAKTSNCAKLHRQRDSSRVLRTQC